MMWQDKKQNENKKTSVSCLLCYKSLQRTKENFERSQSIGKKKGLRRVGLPWKTRNKTSTGVRVGEDEKLERKGMGGPLPLTLLLCLRKAASLGRRMAMWCRSTDLSRFGMGSKVASGGWTQMDYVNKKTQMFYGKGRLEETVNILAGASSKC